MKTIGNGTPGPGRPAGAKNKIDVTVKELFASVVNKFQTDPKYAHVKLEEWGSKNPSLFWPLATKLIPTEVNTHVDGEITFAEIRNYPTKEQADAKVIHIQPNGTVD